MEPRSVAADRHDEWTSFYLWGLVGEQRIDARRFCPGDVALVRTGSNAGTAVVSLLTLGIYMPRKVYVTCAAGSERRVAIGDGPMTRARILALLLSTAATAGCHTTTVSSGRPPGLATVAFDERWHHGVVAGLGEIGGLYDLSAICPQGWAEIVTETTFPNVMAELFSAGVYTPQTVTVRCAREAPQMAPPAVAPPQPPRAPTPTTPPAPPSSSALPAPAPASF